LASELTTLPFSTVSDWLLDGADVLPEATSKEKDRCSTGT